jgi:hypothetical protein
MIADSETRYWIAHIKHIAANASSVVGDDFDQIVGHCNDILCATGHGLVGEEDIERHINTHEQV